MDGRGHLTFEIAYTSLSCKIGMRAVRKYAS